MTCSKDLHEYKLQDIESADIFEEEDDKTKQSVHIYFKEQCTKCNKEREMVLEIYPDSNKEGGCTSSIWRILK